MNANPTNYSQLVKEGFWSENAGVVKLLGLCPLLAVSNTLVNGLSLGLATMLTLLVSSTLVSSVRGLLPAAVRIPLYVLIIASTVTVIELTMQAWLPNLFISLGIFLPLIVTNCLILGRAEAFAARNPIRHAIVDALSMGFGFLMVLVILGGAREIIGQGSLLADSAHLFGDRANDWRIHFFHERNGVLLALLPPGAFIGLGLIVALKNKIDASLALHKESTQ